MVGFVLEFRSISIIYQIRKTCSPYVLPFVNNLDFRMFYENWFNCLLLLVTHYLFYKVKNWEKQKENLDNTTHSLTGLWKSCLSGGCGYIVLFWINEVLLVRTICESSHWEFDYNFLFESTQIWQGKSC